MFNWKSLKFWLININRSLAPRQFIHRVMRMRGTESKNKHAFSIFKQQVQFQQAQSVSKTCECRAPGWKFVTAHRIIKPIRNPDAFARSLSYIQFLFLLHPASSSSSSSVRHKKAGCCSERELIGRGNQEAEGVAIAPRGGSVFVFAACRCECALHHFDTMHEISLETHCREHPMAKSGIVCLTCVFVCYVVVVRLHAAGSANWPRSGSSQ